MEITSYVTSCIADSAFPTYYTLEINTSSGLLTDFRDLRDLSESEGLEYGFKINLNGMNQLVTGTPIKGTEQRVELKTSQWKNEATYIGDCHTHPYQLKMGPDAEIGPSSGDYMEWWTYPPTGFNLAIHFVISVNRVFLIVSRIKTLAQLKSSTKEESGTLKRYTDSNDELQLAAFDDYPKLSHVKKLQARKSAWDTHAPNAAKEFAKENLDYNLDMARLLRFEFYAGPLGAGTTGACKLALLSSQLYGSYSQYFSQYWYP